MISINDVNRIRKMKNLYEHLNILIQFQGKMLHRTELDLKAVNIIRSQRDSAYQVC